MSKMSTGICGLCCTCLSLLILVMAPTARAEPSDPIFTFFASSELEGGVHEPYPSPGGFEGPCGIAVDSGGSLYVADYHRNSVDVFAPYPSLITLAQLIKEDPVDGPCGMAVDSSGSLYVNNFHRNVMRFSISPFPAASGSKFGPMVGQEVVGATIDSEHPTGVAVDPATDNVYVDDRTYIAVYEPSGAPVLDEGVPLRIGLGSLGDGYGVAVSRNAGTDGYVYVPDAADDTVKVYDPTIDADDPIQVIDGHETPQGRFVSLRDAAIAIVQQGGRIYVTDNLQPEYRERPEAAVYAFSSAGAYAGRLKYNIVDALPPGLAVDNSCAEQVPPLDEGTCEAQFPSNGNVYVTSGNTEEALVCGYAGVLTEGVFPAPCRRAPSVAEPALTMPLQAPSSPPSSSVVGGPVPQPQGNAPIPTTSRRVHRKRSRQRRAALHRRHHRFR